MPVLDHLNSQARLALTRAEAVAHGLAHHYVGTEHLLVGLARVPGCAAELALARCGLDGDEVASGLEQLLGRGPHALAVTPPRTAVVELVLARSRWEARALGEDVVTSAHLLLALLHHDGATATTVLRELGADADRLEGFLLAHPVDGVPAGTDPLPTATASGPDRAGPGGVDRREHPGDVAWPAEPGEPLAVRVVRLQRQVERLEAEVANLTAIVRSLSGPADEAPDAPEPRPSVPR